MKHLYRKLCPDFIKKSPLANNTPGGWVEVDPATLQHLRYANVFSLGDASSLPTSKTAAAVRKSAPILSRNLYALIRGQTLQAQYDGYTCCPLITGYHSAIMAEFLYDGKLGASFPLDPTQERYAMYMAKVHVLPWIYWNRILKGKAFEADIFKVFNPLQRSSLRWHTLLKLEIFTTCTTGGSTSPEDCYTING